MYYSYKCTYCGRVFYTYNDSREYASRMLYHSIKNHLIAYNEDHKEYELDDGEAADSNQIYDEMTESNEVPSGGYEAVDTATVDIATQTPETSSNIPTESTASSSGILLFLIIVIIGIVLLLYFNPSFLASITQIFSQ